MRRTYSILVIVSFAMSLAILAGCNEQKTLDKSKTPEAKTLAKTPNGEPVRPDVVPKLKFVECLIAPATGLPIKVIVTREGVLASNGLVPAKANDPGTQPLMFFHPYYVFAEKRIDAVTYLKVGPTPRLKDVQGWVAANDVSPWPTNVGLMPLAEMGKRTAPLMVYASQQAVIDVIETGATAEQPIARALVSSMNRPLWPWPVAESKRIVTKDGRVVEVARIHFLAELKANLMHIGADEAAHKHDADHAAKAQATVRQLDLVFCIDTTGSMAPYIDAVRQAVRRITEQMQSLGGVQPNIAFGVVAYRDHNDKSTSYLTRTFKLQTSAEAMLAQIAGLDADAGGDIPEAMYDGIDAALTEIDWRQGSHRVVCVIADSSAHEPGEVQNPRNLDRKQIVGSANDKGVKLFALVTPLPQKTSEEQRRDKEKLWGQLREITQGAKGEALPLSQASQLVDKMRKIMDLEQVVVADRVKVVKAIIAVGHADKQKIADHAGVEIRKVTEVMEFLPGAGITASKLSPGVPAFSSGWVIIDQPDALTLERQVYISQDDCDMMQHGISGLIRALTQPDKIDEIFKVGLKGRVGLFDEYFSGSPDVKSDGVTLNMFLAANHVACGPKSSLRFTRKQLETMPVDERMKLRARLQQEILPSLVNDLNNADLWRARSAMRYGWIREDHLP